MALYKTVGWQPDDEITSEKLQQMADNEEWLKQNNFSGFMLFEPGQGIESPLVNNLRGRTPGTQTATKFIMAFCTFDTTVPVGQHTLDVPFPTGYFTEPPICVATVSTGTLPLVAYITQDYWLDKVQVGIRYIDNRTDMMDGVINVWAVGV